MDPDPVAWLPAARRYYESGATREPAFRAAQLRGLLQALVTREAALLEALRLDLGKPACESYASEIGWVLGDIRHALRNLARWTRPRRRHVPPGLQPARGRVVPQPYGVVLVIGPWNYPLGLIASPLVAALAAGNCVCLKPSEHAPHVAAEMARLAGTVFPADLVHVVQGGPETADALVRAPFDKIFFTGSTAVGRQVLTAAAANLTPVTLELGGKSPCIVCDDTDLARAARRIVWGKFLNAGQTCVAPDHVWVAAERRDELIAALVQTVRAFYGPDPRASPDYGRIVNARHLRRLTGYLGDGRVICGGESDAADRYLAPTVMTDVPLTSPLMQEEIFGPILPVVTYASLNDVFAELRARPAPLALYAFTDSRAVRARILRETVSGGVCFNDTISHILARELPFGGVGASGMGAYHGQAGFDCFSHSRSVLTRSLRFDPGMVYPPARASLAVLRHVSRWLLGG